MPLQHYVILGNKLSLKWNLFYMIPEGTVIHVESEDMARKVLKRNEFDPDKIFVITDAMEWKDFPADKLSLAMSQYNPESRVSKAQIKARAEKRKKEAEKFQKAIQSWNSIDISKYEVGQFLKDHGYDSRTSANTMGFISNILISAEVKISDTTEMKIGIPSDYVDIDTIGPAIDMMISLYKRYTNDLNRLKFSIRSNNYFNSGTPKLVFSLHQNLHICGYPDITNMASDARLLCDIAAKILPAFEKALASRPCMYKRHTLSSLPSESR